MAEPRAFSPVRNNVPEAPDETLHRDTLRTPGHAQEPAAHGTAEIAYGFHTNRQHQRSTLELRVTEAEETTRITHVTDSNAQRAEANGSLPTGTSLEGNFPRYP